MKLLIYNGHSGGTGGGENHAAGVISLLKNYYDVTVMLDWGKMGWKDEVKEYFGWDLEGVKWIEYNPNLIQNYDQFININHGMLLPPLARRNIVLCFFPQNRWNTVGYDTVICNSNFSKQQVVERWGRNPTDVVPIYPPINVEEFYSKQKKKQIITIGRFFEVPDGNNKNHLLMIEQFKKIKDPDLKFVIVGGVQHENYFRSCVEAAKSDPRIEFREGLTRSELKELYAESSIYWHATGYGTDLPSSMEHFGMVAVEAMASHCIPIVHKSGGMPESGALTWEEPDDLVRLTKQYLANTKNTFAMRTKLYKHAMQRFNIQLTTAQLIEAIEKPVALYRPELKDDIPAIDKVYINSNNITVGMVTDAPNLTTGFGVVCREFGKGFLREGFQITQVGLQDANHEPRQDPWRVWRPGAPLSPEFLAEWIKKDKPDVLWLNYDAGNISAWLNMLAALKCSIPVIAYFPIEGFPIPKGFIDMAKMIAAPVTYLKWGSDLMYEQSGLRVKWIPHGLDHAKFHRFDEDRRHQLKSDIGWEKRFVIGAFGRNKRTKQQPRLIETMAILKKHGLADNVVLYLHTQPFEQFLMQGWMLPDIVEYNDVKDMVAFPPQGFSQIFGIDYEQPGQIAEGVLTKADWDLPENQNQARAMILESYSMIERYNMCDLYISVSQAEGFNLPLGEAMACGVPILCVNDDGSQAEVVSGAGELINPIEWDTWHIGTLLPIVSKQQLANKICELMADSTKRSIMSDQSLMKAATYKWSESCRAMNQVVKETYIKVRA